MLTDVKEGRGGSRNRGVSEDSKVFGLSPWKDRGGIFKSDDWGGGGDLEGG